MFKSNFILLPIGILLSACATTEPVIKTVIKEVEVPISVPCKAEIPPVPDFKFSTLKPEDNLFDKSKTVLADRKLHLAYEGELLTALKSCLK